MLIMFIAMLFLFTAMFLSIHCDVPSVISFHCLFRWLDSRFSSIIFYRVVLPQNVDPVFPGVEECFYLVSLAFCYVLCLRADLRSHPRLHFLVRGCNSSCDVLGFFVRLGNFLREILRHS